MCAKGRANPFVSVIPLTLTGGRIIKNPHGHSSDCSSQQFSANEYNKDNIYEKCNQFFQYDGSRSPPITYICDNPTYSEDNNMWTCNAGTSCMFDYY